HPGPARPPARAAARCGRRRRSRRRPPDRPVPRPPRSRPGVPRPPREPWSLDPQPSHPLQVIVLVGAAHGAYSLPVVVDAIAIYLTEVADRHLLLLLEMVA